MKATELRIGNYVLDRGNKLILIDHWEYINKISSKREENFHPLTEFVDYLKPIPLTEEWLVKFGFEEVDGNDYYKFFDLQEFRLFVNKKDNSCFIHYKQSSIDYLINNLHVHSLQNLYFALTGEELELIENKC